MWSEGIQLRTAFVLVGGDVVSYGHGLKILKKYTAFGRSGPKRGEPLQKT